MKRYNIVVGKKYEKNGEEKTQWNTVGTLVRFDATPEKPESFLLELPIFGATKFHVFEQKPREEARPAPAPAAEEEINPDDIPF